MHNLGSSYVPYLRVVTPLVVFLYLVLEVEVVFFEINYYDGDVVFAVIVSVALISYLRSDLR